MQQRFYLEAEKKEVFGATTDVPWSRDSLDTERVGSGKVEQHGASVASMRGVLSNVGGLYWE